jgi:hypothetical protein
MLKLMLSAAVASIMVCSAAYAGTLPAHSQAGSSDIVQIKHGDNDHGGDRRDWGDDDWRGRGAQNFEPYQHYGHRYAYRPDDWNDRGCVAVGPVWYCQ